MNGYSCCSSAWKSTGTKQTNAKEKDKCLEDSRARPGIEHVIPPQSVPEDGHLPSGETAAVSGIFFCECSSLYCFTVTSLLSHSKAFCTTRSFFRSTVGAGDSGFFDLVLSLVGRLCRLRCFLVALFLHFRL